MLLGLDWIWVESQVNDHIRVESGGIWECSPERYDFKSILDAFQTIHPVGCNHGLERIAPVFNWQTERPRYVDGHWDWRDSSWMGRLGDDNLCQGS